MMFEQNVRRCADRIISIYQPHLRPIVRGKSKATVEFGAKIGASIVSGYTYVNHVSWDAYNESSDLGMQLELYKRRFGMLPRRYRPTSSIWGKRIGSTSSPAMSIATTVHWADLQRKRTTHTQRIRREPSASEMR